MHKLDPSTDTPGMKHSLKNIVPRHKKDKEFKALFQRQNDVLLDDYSCAYIAKSLIMHGRLYISDAVIAFYSYILGRKTIRLISLDEVIGVYKKNTAFLIPNAIEVVTHRTKYYFGSFMFRDQAFKLISSTWCSYVDKNPGDKLYQVAYYDKLGAYLLFEKRGNMMVRVCISDSCCRDKDNGQTSRAKELGICEITEEALFIDQQKATDKEDICETLLGEKIDKKNTDEEEALGLHKKSEDIDEADSDDTLLSEERNIGDEIAETLGVPKNTSCSHISESTEHYKHTLAKTSYNISLGTLFKKMWISRQFWLEYADQMNFLEFELGDWKLSDQQCCLTRTLNYKIIFSTLFGTKNAEVECHHHMNWQNNLLIVETSNVTNNIPISNAFTVCERWYMIPKSSSGNYVTDLELSMGILWKKNVWGLKNTIKSKSIEGSANSWDIINKLIDKTFKPISEQPQDSEDPAPLPAYLVSLPHSTELPPLKPKKPKRKYSSKSLHSSYLHLFTAYSSQLRIILIFLLLLVSISFFCNLYRVHSSSSDKTYQQHFLQLEQQLYDLDVLIRSTLDLTSSGNPKRPNTCTVLPI